MRVLKDIDYRGYTNSALNTFARKNNLGTKKGLRFFYTDEELKTLENIISEKLKNKKCNPGGKKSESDFNFYGYKERECRQTGCKNIIKSEIDKRGLCITTMCPSCKQKVSRVRDTHFKSSIVKDTSIG